MVAERVWSNTGWWRLHFVILFVSWHQWTLPNTVARNRSQGDEQKISKRTVYSCGQYLHYYQVWHVEEFRCYCITKTTLLKASRRVKHVWKVFVYDSHKCWTSLLKKHSGPVLALLNQTQFLMEWPDMRRIFVNNQPQNSKYSWQKTKGEFHQHVQGDCPVD